MTEILILGAGMVGVATALALQARGHDCILVDRLQPGSETSYGNAGFIQAEALEPYTLPSHPLSLLRMALGDKNAVSLNWASLPGQGLTLIRYWRSSMAGNMQKVIPIWSQLISEAIPRHSDLIAAAGAGNLIKKNGYWLAFETEKGLSAAKVQADRYRALYGIDAKLVIGRELQKAEPALIRPLAGAIHWTSPWTCLDPGALVGAYVRLFEQRGGRMVRGDALTLSRAKTGWTAAGESGEQAVMALGPWSPALLRRFGYAIQMVPKRGYHQHYKSRVGLSRPMLLADHSIALAPMLNGLRITTGAELSVAAPRANPRQLSKGVAVVRTLLEIEDHPEDAPWSGTRPCLPGMLPLVCQAPRHRGLWFHFGHGHQGFTLGPVTAERLASAMDGDVTAIAGLDVGV